MRTVSSSLETSAATALTMPPLLRISAAAASAWARSLAAMSTRAPWRAKTRAMPFPIPLLAPVTMTERPSIDVSTYDPVGVQDGLSNSSDSNTRYSLGSSSLPSRHRFAPLCSWLPDGKLGKTCAPSRRERKLNLIRTIHPEFNDLAQSWDGR